MRCDECGSSNNAFQTGEMVCLNCGLILEESEIDNSSFKQGQNALIEDPRLATAGGLGHSGRIFKHSWSFSRKEINIKHAKQEIESLASKLLLPKHLVTEAIFFFSKVNKTTFCQGRNLQVVIVTCLYRKMRDFGLYRPIQDYETYSGICKVKLLRCLKQLSSFFKLNPIKNNIAAPIEYFGNKIGLTPEIQNRAVRIFLEKQAEFEKCRLQTAVITCLYIAHKEANLKIPQRKFCMQVGMNEQTLRKYIKLFFSTNFF